VAARAGDTGRLFGAVTVADIAEAVKQSGGPDIDKRRIEIGQPIRSTGEYTVAVRVHPEVSAKLTLTVVAG
jgi:large subunit ribosomal protein L9